jgi:hypothetical protein
MMEEKTQVGETFGCFYVCEIIVTLQSCPLQAKENSDTVCKLVAHLLKFLAIVGFDAIIIETKPTNCSKFTGTWVFCFALIMVMC